MSFFSLNSILHSKCVFAPYSVLVAEICEQINISVLNIVKIKVKSVAI